MGKQERVSAGSAEEKWQELRKSVKESEALFQEAKVRKSIMAFCLFEEVPSLYGLDRDLREEVSKFKGERLHKLKEGLYDIFAKAGKTTSDEVLKSRIRTLILEHLAAKPRIGRRKKVS
jgi:hypothetical protein